MENKFLNELIKFSKKDKQLKKIKDLDVLGKDFRFVVQYKNAKERGDNPLVYRDYNGFIRITLSEKKEDIIVLEDFKNNRHLYERFCQSLDNIIPFEELKMYSDDHEIVKNLLLSYIDYFKKNNDNKKIDGFYIFGDNKLGKTSICKTFIYNLKKIKVDAEILKAQLIGDLFLSENKDIIYELKNKKVLVIDDIGQSYLSEFYLAQLTELLDYRFENNLLTIFNSNFSIDSLHDEFLKRTSKEKARRLHSRIKGLSKQEFEFLEGDI